MAMVLGIGGPPLATLTCLATVVVAGAAGAGVESAVEKLKALLNRQSARTKTEYER